VHLEGDGSLLKANEMGSDRDNELGRPELTQLNGGPLLAGGPPPSLEFKRNGTWDDGDGKRKMRRSGGGHRQDYNSKGKWSWGSLACQKKKERASSTFRGVRDHG